MNPNLGLLYRLTNNTWSTTRYRALQATLTKNMTRGFQMLFTVQRQWQHLDGTWNPTDPARFIQPDAFANNKNIWRTDGVQDQNSLATGNTLVNNPMWNPYSVRMAGTWRAPYGLNVSGSYTIVAGNWTGPVIDQLPANSPLIAPFGPSTVVSTTGVRQPNPLATRIRFKYPTRGEGQPRALDVHIVGIKAGKRIGLGGAKNRLLSRRMPWLPRCAGVGFDAVAEALEFAKPLRCSTWCRTWPTTLYGTTRPGLTTVIGVPTPARPRRTTGARAPTADSR